jgi:hypothetical protein
MRPMFLTGMAAARAIAWIKSLGNFGGLFGSWYVGFIKDLTGSYAGGLYGLALFGVVSAFVCAFFLHIPDPAVSVRTSEALRAAMSEALRAGGNHSCQSSNRRPGTRPNSCVLCVTRITSRATAWPAISTS